MMYTVITFVLGVLVACCAGVSGYLFALSRRDRAQAVSAPRIDGSSPTGGAGEWNDSADRRLQEVQHEAGAARRDLRTALDVILNSLELTSDSRRRAVELRLNSLGVARFDPERGDRYDESKHEDLQGRADLGGRPATIAQVHEVGWLWKNTVIRRARVVVEPATDSRYHVEPQHHVEPHPREYR